MDAPKGSATGEWIAVCDTADVFEGAGRRYELPGYPPLAVFNVDGAFHVTDDTCTHGMASLSEGELVGDKVKCPWHGGVFNVRSGQPLSRPCGVPNMRAICQASRFAGNLRIAAHN